MNFKSYPIYKDSGVEWLGEVPEHWGVKRLGLHFCQRSEKVSDRDYPPLSVTKNGIVPQLESAAKTNDGDNRKLVLSGDYVINSRSDRKGSSGVSTLDGSVSLINIVLKPYLKLISPNFSHFLLRSYLFQEEFYKYGHGIVADLWTTNYSDMKNIYLAIPPLYEQNQIVAFLDSETSRIDNLIAKQEKLIEKLEEHRKSLISHAVTKGLDPNAKMKDSGVEWLGEVPEHFDHIKIKQLAISKLTYGANESAEQEIKEHPRYIRITDIKNDGTLNPESFKSLPPEIAEQYLLANNDILFARSGATVGKTFKYSDSWGVCCFAGYLIKLSVNVKIANPDYVFYYLNSHPYWEYIASNQSQSTIQNVSADKYANFTIAIPKIFEQEKIVSFLDFETSRIDNLIAKQEKLIEKLKEYRTSIISYAVTGKIDVRDLVA